LCGSHSFFDDSFKTADTDAELILEKFANCTDATVAKVVDVVASAKAVSKTEVVADG
jgi:hypothetical protein